MSVVYVHMCIMLISDTVWGKKNVDYLKPGILSAHCDVMYACIYDIYVLYETFIKQASTFLVYPELCSSLQCL